jgi:hypothetical protein
MIEPTTTTDPARDIAAVPALPDQGFTEYAWGPPKDPVTVAYVRHGSCHVDWIVARTPMDAGACRTMLVGGHDLLTATVATWSLAGSAGDMARAVSGLSPADHAEHLYPIPAACRLPPTQPTIVRQPHASTEPG